MSIRELEDYLVPAGRIWTAEHSVAVVASGANLVVGFTTGLSQLIALRRTYSSSGNLLTINLYEQTFTGGSNILRTYNRNLAVAGTPPVQMRAGVTFTPNTVIASVTARGQTGANNAQVTVPDENPLVLKRGTSYVLELINGDINNAAMGFSINIRDVQPTDYSV